MREIRTSGLMSGERKRSDAHRAQATAPLLDSTPIRIFGFWSELSIKSACTPDGRETPYLPFIEIVRTSFRIPSEADGSEVEDRLRRGLTVLGADIEATLPYLLNLLGQDGGTAIQGERASETVGIRTREAIHLLLRERSRISPVVLLLEDLHWIDRASAELIDRAFAGSDIPRLLVVTKRRTEYSPPWAAFDGLATLPLSPLSGGGTVELLKARLGVEAVPEDLAALISNKAEGNPLFVEELVGWLDDEGRLTTDDEGVRFEMGATPLPASLANLLMERFDHLAAGPRAALEAAAVLGRRFPPGLLAEVAEDDDDAESLLRPLLAADLVMANAEDGGYEFRNALIRDAVYDRLLGSRRAELHGRAGRALERVHANRPEEAADVLAHHYGRGENSEKAMRYLALAGDRSLAVHALDEATERYHAVLDLFERHPGAADDGFLADVLLGLALIYYFSVDFGALIRMVEAHLPRIEALGDPKRLSCFLFEAGYAHVFGGWQDIGKPLLERALAIGEEAAVDYANKGLSWHYAYWEPPGAERRATMRRLAEEAAEWGRQNGDIWVASKALVSQGNEGAI